MIYRASPADGPLRQGEVLSGIVQTKLVVTTIGTDEPEVVPVDHPFVLIASQDCDLEHAFTAVRDGRPLPLPSVLLFEATTVDALVSQLPPGRDIRKRILQNDDFRYHVMQGIAVEFDTLRQGIPDLGIDFKRYFTIPTDELYAQLQHGARRRAVLESPYLEHFVGRANGYASRIALPVEHAVRDPLAPAAGARGVAPPPLEPANVIVTIERPGPQPAGR